MKPNRSIAIAFLCALLLGMSSACRPGSDRVERPDAAAPSGPELHGLGYEIGLADAPVTVVEFSDFGCPYCARFALEIYPELHTEFVLSGQVRWVYLPFVLGIFPNGADAALAAECAGDQDRFWPMHDLLYEHQREWKETRDPDRLFLELAARSGLDPARFERCYREQEPADRLEMQNQIARQIGIRATPSFVIQNQLVQGALPPEQFRAVLQRAVEGG